MLGALERKRAAEPLVVIGVHSGKFEAEGEARRIQQAMERYGVAHPVVVDVGHRIWSSYAVRSWPTLVIIRPDGTLAAVAPGEADLDPLDEFVGRVLEEARADGTLAAERIDLSRPAPTPAGLLSFPGKVIALGHDRLAVSDTGHHRVLLVDLQGAVLRVIGDGRAGLVDGPFAEARFRAPQGLAYDASADLLFVADTGNHVLRELDLTRGGVRTVAGTGELGRGVPAETVRARTMPLRSPWDLALAGDYVLLAMAGAHQVWAYHRRERTIGVLAGSGHEGLEDGPFGGAAFAQPSGLVLAGPHLYLADSETSAVRALELARGEVRTLVGQGLFDFGDVDGPRAQALLQHPLGISHGPAGLLVADTYNDKVRRVDEKTGEVSTYFRAAGEVALREPGGLCQLADGRVIVADTNHHRLVEVAPGARAARVLELHARQVVPLPTAARPAPVPAPSAKVEVGPAGLLLLVEAARGTKITAGSIVALRARADGPLILAAPEQTLPAEAPQATVVVSAPRTPAEGTLEIDVDAVVCGTRTESLCWPVSEKRRVPVTLVDAPRAAELHLVLPDPRLA